MSALAGSIQHVSQGHVNKSYPDRQIVSLHFVQDDYNAKHRRLCQPPFRNKTVLQGFAGVISGR